LGPSAFERRMLIARGSGNALRDLGFPQAEAENLPLRTQLMRRFREVTKQFGVTQPRVNDLLRDELDKFCLDALVNMLAKAGMRVELRLKKAA
jgi:predicted XRE-type DNA-binding protein